MNPRAQARQMRIVENTAALLDYTSRYLGAVEAGNWHYAGEKLPPLRAAVDRLEQQLDPTHMDELRHIKGVTVWGKVAALASGHWLGRLLFGTARKVNTRPQARPNPIKDPVGYLTSIGIEVRYVGPDLINWRTLGSPQVSPATLRDIAAAITTLADAAADARAEEAR